MTTMSIPSGDQAIWWLECWCHSKRVPTGIGNVPTIATGARCPFVDTTWHDTPFRKWHRLASVGGVNENHALCETSEWAEYTESEVLEPPTAGLGLGADSAGVGPPP